MATVNWDVLLIFTCYQQLDSVTRQEWERLNVSEHPSFSAFSDFIQWRAQFLESAGQGIKNGASLAQTSPINNKGHRLVTHLTVQTTYPVCHHCKGGHLIGSNCTHFKMLSEFERLERARALKICRNCVHWLPFQVEVIQLHLGGGTQQVLGQAGLTPVSVTVSANHGNSRRKSNN